MAATVTADDTQTSTSAATEPTETASYYQSTLGYVLVPYGWLRQITETGAVYYITPSGRALLTPEEAVDYIGTSTAYCKCNLNVNLAFTEVFHFDPTIGSLFLPKPAEISRCIHWISTLSQTELTSRLQAVRLYINSLEASDRHPQEVRQAAALPALPDGFDWQQVLVTNSGETFARHLSTSQMKHLAFELAQLGVDLNSVDVVVNIEDNEDQESLVLVTEDEADMLTVDQQAQLFVISKDPTSGEYEAVSLEANGIASPVEQVFEVEEVSETTPTASTKRTPASKKKSTRQSHTLTSNVELNKDHADDSATEIDEDGKTEQLEANKPTVTLAASSAPPLPAASTSNTNTPATPDIRRRSSRKSAAAANSRRRLSDRQTRLLRAYEIRADKAILEQLKQLEVRKKRLKSNGSEVVTPGLASTPRPKRKYTRKKPKQPEIKPEPKAEPTKTAAPIVKVAPMQSSDVDTSTIRGRLRSRSGSQGPTSSSGLLPPSRTTKTSTKAAKKKENSPPELPPPPLSPVASLISTDSSIDPEVIDLVTSDEDDEPFSLEPPAPTQPPNADHPDHAPVVAAAAAVEEQHPEPTQHQPFNCCIA